MERPSDWRAAERRYADEVIGDGTIPELFAQSTERHAERTAQGYKGGVYDRSLAGSVVERAPVGEYRTLTYAEMGEIVRYLTAGFRDLGVEAGDRVGIYADTRMEWAQCDFSLLSTGAVVTTVYTDSSVEQVEYLLTDPGTSGVVCGTAALAERVVEAIEADDRVEGDNSEGTDGEAVDNGNEDGLAVEFVVVMDDFEASRFDDSPIPVHTLEAVYDRGEAQFDREAYDALLGERSPEDLACHERIKRFELVPTEWTPENDLLTPSMKKKHRNLRSRFTERIEAIYDGR